MPDSLIPVQAVDEGMLPRLRAAVPAERRELLMAMLSAELARALGLAPDARIDPRRSVVEMGLDSLRAVDVKIAVEKSLDCALPTTLLFDYPTLESLVNYFVDEVLTLEPAPAVQSARGGGEADVAAQASELAALTEAELASLLAKELADTSVERPR